MTIAELHGKISSENISDRSEDLLTSNIFGCFRYTPPDYLLIPFLKTAKTLTGDFLSVPEQVKTVYYSFWPRLNSHGRAACEPDVLLGLETESGLHVIMVEAKFYSGPSSPVNDETLPNHQLAREFDQLQSISGKFFNPNSSLTVKSRHLIYLTKDYQIPNSDIEEASKEYSIKKQDSSEIYWTSWCLLPAILEDRLQREQIAERRALAEDMLALLQRKWLILFSGVEKIGRDFFIPDFYQNSEVSYKWPQVAAVPDLNYQYVPRERTYFWPKPSQCPAFSYRRRPSFYKWPSIPIISEIFRYEVNKQ